MEWLKKWLNRKKERAFVITFPQGNNRPDKLYKFTGEKLAYEEQFGENRAYHIYLTDNGKYVCVTEERNGSWSAGCRAVDIYDSFETLKTYLWQEKFEAIIGAAGRRDKGAYYNMKILLTGNKGFVGSHIQASLENDGHEIVGLEVHPTFREWYDKMISVTDSSIDAIVHAGAMPYNQSKSPQPLSLEHARYLFARMSCKQSIEPQVRHHQPFHLFLVIPCEQHSR